MLDERVAGLAALLLGESLLELLKSERVLTRAEMLDLWNLEQQAEEIAERARARRDRRRAARRNAPGRAASKQLARAAPAPRARERGGAAPPRAAVAAGARRRSATAAARRQPRVAAQLERALRRSRDGARRRRAVEHASSAAATSRRPRAQLELGHQLARNPKLKRMAQLVGRMRESARALRRTLYERANAEVFAVGQGADLSRLLPPELLSLRHPVLRRDFRRRLLDGELLVYALRAREQRGRGPMIVCLDGSSSMAGDKEIWAKAVTLTLLDIAARQRRRFRSICFSSAETPLQVLELNARQRSAPEMSQVFALAEYFPGGGTDFQKPLDAALECLRADRRAARRHGVHHRRRVPGRSRVAARLQAREDAPRLHRLLGADRRRPELARRGDGLQRPHHLGAPADRRRDPRDLPEGLEEAPSPRRRGDAEVIATDTCPLRVSLPPW